VIILSNIFTIVHAHEIATLHYHIQGNKEFQSITICYKNEIIHTSSNTIGSISRIITTPQLLDVYLNNQKTNPHQLWWHQGIIDLYISGSNEIVLIKNSPLNEVQSTITKACNVFDITIKTIEQQILITSSLQEKLKLKYALIETKIARNHTIINELNKHPESYLRLYYVNILLQDYRIDQSQVNRLFNYTHTTLKTYPLWQQCDSLIRNQNFKMKNGDTIHEFILPNDQMQIVDVLADAKNKKYIYLDFWASYCAPCRKYNKATLAIFEKYNKDVLFVSISEDTDKESWEQASKQDGISWHNLCDLKGKKSYIINLFQAYSMPTGVLITKEGVVIENNFHPSYLIDKLYALLHY